MQVLQMRAMHEAQRLLVMDEKLRILYASDTLAKMLGATVTALTSLNMTALIAPPAAQLHKRWVTVSDVREQRRYLFIAVLQYE